MRKKILNYVKKVDEFLQNPPQQVDYIQEAQAHYIQIQFFMHERLVHELVMILFALCAVIIFVATVVSEQIMFVILLAGILVLLFPYILHYYVLENSVQKMYEQYDEMIRRGRQEK